MTTQAVPTPAPLEAPKGAARIATIAARVLLGLCFFVFGLNFFFNFIPKPAEPPPAAAADFAGALFKSGYLFPLVKTIEVVCGAALLANRFVPLALTLLAPIIVNIVAFHLLLEKSGAPMVLAILALELYLAWAHRAAWRPLFTAKYAA